MGRSMWTRGFLSLELLATRIYSALRARQARRRNRIFGLKSVGLKQCFPALFFFAAPSLAIPPSYFMCRRETHVFIFVINLISRIQQKHVFFHGSWTSLIKTSCAWHARTFSVFQSFRGSLTAVSTPIFASKASFFSVFRALHFLLCTSPEFCDFSIPLHRFLLKNTAKPKKKVDQITTDLRVELKRICAPCVAHVFFHGSWTSLIKTSCAWHARTCMRTTCRQFINFISSSLFISKFDFDLKRACKLERFRALPRAKKILAQTHHITFRTCAFWNRTCGFSVKKSLLEYFRTRFRFNFEELKSMAWLFYKFQGRGTVTCGFLDFFGMFCLRAWKQITSFRHPLISSQVAEKEELGILHWFCFNHLVLFTSYYFLTYPMWLNGCADCT